MCLESRCTADHTAGDLISRVARRLCPEVVRTAVDDDGSADDVFDTETVCHHRQIGRPTAGEQRREIPRVQWVFLVIWIIVAAGIGKIRPRTVSVLMNVKCKETCICNRHTTDFSNHQCSVFARDKPDSSAQVGMCVSSTHTSDCCGALISCHIPSPHSSLCDGVQKVTLFYGLGSAQSCKRVSSPDMLFTGWAQAPSRHR